MGSLNQSFHDADQLLRKIISMPDSELSKLFTFDGISYWDISAPFLIYSGFADAFDRFRLKKEPAVIPKRAGLEFRSKVLRAALAFLAYSGNFRKIDSLLKPNVLLLGFTNYFSREILHPLYDYMQGGNNGSPLLVNDLVWRGLPQRGQIKQTHSIWNYWNRSTQKSYAEMLQQLETSRDSLRHSEILKDTIEGHSPGLFPYLQASLENVLYWTFSRVAAYHVLARQLLVDASISGVINPDVSDYRTRIFEAVAMQKNIGTLGVQFGIYGKNDVEWSFFRSHHLAVTGTKNYEIMLQLGVKPEKMTITGSPRFDFIANMNGDPKPLEEEEKVDKGRKIKILFASQPFYFGAFSSPEARIEMIQSLFDAINLFPDLTLLVKPHPVESVEELSALIQGRPNISLINRETDIRHLTLSSDAFVTFFSGSTFEALALGKPVMNLAFPSSYVDTVFIEAEATFIARNKQDIEKFLTDLTQGDCSTEQEELKKKGKLFLNSWFECSRGIPSQNISDLMSQYQGRPQV